MSGPGMQQQPLGGVMQDPSGTQDPQQQAMRMALIKSMMQQQQPSNTRWGGLANAGNSLAGAYMANRMNQQANPNYQTDMTRYGMTPQEIQSAAGPMAAQQPGQSVNPVMVQGSGSLGSPAQSPIQQALLAGLVQ